MTPDMRWAIVARNRQIAIEHDRIVAPQGAFELTVELPMGEIRPGLINAHDHLHRNHYGRLGRGPYTDAVTWGDDIQMRYRHHIAARRRLPRRAALLEGAWKNLFAGVTSVVHHDRWEADFGHFPLRVVPLASADSLGRDPDLRPPVGGGAMAIHVAEGVDAGSAGHIAELDARGLLTRDLIAVHGVGADAQGIARLRAAGAALVWCPSSNLFLFGRTAPAALLAPGIDLLLGSDSLLTGAGDLLDEIGCARRLGLVTDERLEAAVGSVAAWRLGLAPPSLEPGSPADLVVLARPLLKASARDVLLVIVGGVARVADPELAPVLAGIFPHGATMQRGPLRRWTNPWVAQAQPWRKCG